jgi:uncharacterized membrane protein
MNLLATIRPDDWNLALFLHVLAAFVMVGALVTAAAYLFAARRDGSLELTRAGFRSLLIAALPAFIATRLSAQWLVSKEGLEDAELAWLDFGFITTDVGLLVLVGATVAAGLAVRRAEGVRGVALAAWLVAALIAVYAVVIWLMATKPA